MRYDIASAQALAIAEAGVDETIYQLNQNPNYSGETNTSFGNGVYTSTISNINTNTKRITITGSVPNATNPTATKIVTMLANINSSFVSFHYGVQVGSGGINLENLSIVNGNLYSNGSITGGGTVTGDAIVASSTGLINGVTVQGTARAHSLSNCTVNGDAYYQNISECSVSGEMHPESADPATEAMPITEEQIDEWEEIAADGTIINEDYEVDGSQTLGPTLINGDLIINDTLILGGVVWVKGNITFQNNSELSVSSITGNEGAVLIADVPGSETTKGIVDLSNNMTVSGNGSAGSFPMILSTNSGSQAISLKNNASSVILYASRGTVSVSNNAGANQITAHQISLGNGAEITYVSGLQNQIFSNGPGGSWAIVPRTYSIVR